MPSEDRIREAGFTEKNGEFRRFFPFFPEKRLKK
jgi:hypothetical protein